MSPLPITPCLKKETYPAVPNPVTVEVKLLSVSEPDVDKYPKLPNPANVDCKLAVESQIYQYHGATTNAQIRCNYEIIFNGS